MQLVRAQAGSAAWGVVAEPVVGTVNPGRAAAVRTDKGERRLVLQLVPPAHFSVFVICLRVFKPLLLPLSESLWKAPQQTQHPPCASDLGCCSGVS